MTFAGVVVGCWLAIAGIAFLAISGLGRLAARGDVDSDLAIVGEAELRMLVGSPSDGLRVFHTNARPAFDSATWISGISGDHFGHDHAGYTR
ncbi:MAG TPA: hypothetical protein VGI76_07130 [Solirubrobacteraceae bacterium]|jgi:hypothetical protein